MDFKLLMLISFYYSVRCEALSTPRRIEHFIELSQQVEIIKDFYAEIQPFQKINSKYFYIENNRAANWFEALHKCRELGADLVDFQSEQDLNAVISKLHRKKCYWLSLTNFSNKSEYISITSGRPPSFTKWNRGEPNNLANMEHCGQLVIPHNEMQFFYNDIHCYRQCYFICETKLPTQTNIVIW